MKLSNTSQYAINVMVAIATHKDAKLLNAKSISENFEIPYKYLTRIAPKLVEAHLIISTRGREGGYTLAKASSEITILAIIESVNDSIHDNKCILKIKDCNSQTKCALHEQWKIPKKEIVSMFKNTTLETITLSK